MYFYERYIAQYLHITIFCETNVGKKSFLEGTLILAEFLVSKNILAVDHPQAMTELQINFHNQCWCHMMETPTLSIFSNHKK